MTNKVFAKMNKSLKNGVKGRNTLSPILLKPKTNEPGDFQETHFALPLPNLTLGPCQLPLSIPKFKLLPLVTVETGTVAQDRKAIASRFDNEKILNYIEKRSLPRFPWLQLSEGKLFCKVRNMQILS